MAAEILPCDCAPGGSVLVYTGTNSGGRGSQYFFQRGEGDDTEHSVLIASGMPSNGLARA